MRTYRQYLSEELEDFGGDRFGSIDSSPNSNSQRRDSATGGADSSNQKEGYGLLFEIARIAVRKAPNKVLSFFKTIQDDELQEKIKELENQGHWGANKGAGDIPKGDPHDRIGRNMPDNQGGDNI